MTELGLVPLVNGSATRLLASARPDSPVVPDRPPGRLRLFAAGALHRLAARLFAAGALHRLAARLDGGPTTADAHARRPTATSRSGLT